MALPEDIQKRAFYTCWTCKEAYLKARGIIGLDKFSVSVNPEQTPQLLTDLEDSNQVGSWFFSLIEIDPKWCAAAVTQDNNIPIKYWRFEQSQ